MDVLVAADGRDMVAFSTEVWTIFGVIAVATVMAILSAAATARQQECGLHDLKIRVQELRAAYQRRLAELRRSAEVPDVEPVAGVSSADPLDQAA